MVPVDEEALLLLVEEVAYLYKKQTVNESHLDL